MHTETIEEGEQEMTNREVYQNLNPASTTSSLENAERNAIIQEQQEQHKLQPMTASSINERQSYAQVEMAENDVND